MSLDHYVENLTTSVVRGVMNAWWKLVDCVRSRPEFKRIDWRVCNPNTGDADCAENREEIAFSDDFTLILQKARYGNVRRYAVHWSDQHRNPYVIEDLFDSPTPPWLFIGYVDETGNVFDHTHDVREYVCSGNHVRPELLTYIVPKSLGMQWVYIDPQTLKQEHFPSEGFLIENAEE